MVTVIPVIGGMLLMGNKFDRVVAIISAPLAFNVVLLCNSRGALLSLLASAMVFPLMARGAARKKALIGLALGGLGALALLGDTRIIDRFMTVFVSGEERDYSAGSRLVFWKAGMNMIADHPLGGGGGAFKKIYGEKYLAGVGVDEVRSVHNGYINEACEWGLQGLALRLTFFVSVFLLLIRAQRKRGLNGDKDANFFGACLAAGLTADLCSSVFGNYLDHEWGLWLAAMAVASARISVPVDAEQAHPALAAGGAGQSSPPVNKYGAVPAGYGNP
jgi:putative inorganic carbon (hco3(-)) transporter